MRQIIKFIITYLYLFLGYSYIIYFLSYNIRIANKLEGWAYMIAIVLIYFIAYSIINHLFISRLLSHKLLLIIEALLFVSMLTLVISDFRYEEYLHFKYLQRTMTISVTAGAS